MPSLMTVAAFCRDNSICRATFYALVAAGKGPKISKIGRATRISAEAAAEWRKGLEQPQPRRAA